MEQQSKKILGIAWLKRKRSLALRRAAAKRNYAKYREQKIKKTLEHYHKHKELCAARQKLWNLVNKERRCIHTKKYKIKKKSELIKKELNRLNCNIRYYKIAINKLKQLKGKNEKTI
jgi:hypothetical protein